MSKLEPIALPQDLASWKIIDKLYELYLEVKVRASESKEERNRMRQYVKYIQDKLMVGSMSKLKLLAESVVGYKVDTPKIDQYLRRMFWRLVLKKFVYRKKTDFAEALLRRAIRIVQRFKKFQDSGKKGYELVKSKLQEYLKQVKSEKRQKVKKSKPSENEIQLQKADITIDNRWVPEFLEKVLGILQVRFSNGDYKYAEYLVKSMVNYSEPTNVPKYVKDIVYVTCRKVLLEMFNGKPWDVFNPRLEGMCKLLWRS
jgi:hypothetical protein